MLIENDELYTALYNQLMPFANLNPSLSVNTTVDYLKDNINNIISSEYSRMVDQYKIYAAPRSNFNVVITDKIEHMENSAGALELRYNIKPAETYIRINMVIPDDHIINALNAGKIKNYLHDIIMRTVHEFYHYMQYYNESVKILKANPKAKRAEFFGFQFGELKINLSGFDLTKQDLLSEFIYFSNPIEIEAYADGTALEVISGKNFEYKQNINFEEFFKDPPNHPQVDLINNLLDTSKYLSSYARLSKNPEFIPAMKYFMECLKARLLYHSVGE